MSINFKLIINKRWQYDSQAKKSKNSYHIPVKYENSLDSDIISILNEIENNLLNTHSNISENKIVVADNVYIDKRMIKVYSLKYEDNNECSFKVDISLFYETDYSSGQMGFTLLCSFSLNEYIRIDDTIYLILNIEEKGVPIKFLDLDNTDIVNALFPKKEDSILVVHTDIPFKRIIGLKNAFNGFPSNSSGKFIRMLYLSTFTITTASQGDILPITNPCQNSYCSWNNIWSINYWFVFKFNC